MTLLETIKNITKACINNIKEITIIIK